MSRFAELYPSMNAIGAVSVASAVYCVYYHIVKNDFKDEGSENGLTNAQLARSIEDEALGSVNDTSTENNETQAGKNFNVSLILWQLIYRLLESKKPQFNTFLKEVLTDELFDRLSKKKTDLGSTLDECIRPGTDNPEGNLDDSEKGCGVVAYDAQCYILFRELFDKIVKLRHQKFEMNSENQRLWDMSTFRLLKLPSFDPSQVVRVDIAIHRNFQNRKFPPGMDKKSRLHLMTLVGSALIKCAEATDEKASSVLYDLGKLTEVQREELVRYNLLPEIPSNFYDVSAGLRKDWPDGRAVWLCKELNLSAILNVADHLVLTASTSDGRLDKLAKTLSMFIGDLVKILKQESEKFAIDNEFGYLTSFPELLGPSIVFRAEIHVQLISNENEENLKTQLHNTGLRVRSINVNESTNRTELIIETNVSLGYHDYKLVQLFEGGVERVLKVQNDHLLETETD